MREHHGRIVDAPGDNVLAEFPSAVEAVQCAVEVQRELADRNATLEPSRRMEFRIGIHVGDVILDDGKIYGDGVNIAARLEALAAPGGRFDEGWPSSNAQTKWIHFPLGS